MSLVAQDQMSRIVADKFPLPVSGQFLHRPPAPFLRYSATRQRSSQTEVVQKIALPQFQRQASRRYAAFSAARHNQVQPTSKERSRAVQLRHPLDRGSQFLCAFLCWHSVPCDRAVRAKQRAKGRTLLCDCFQCDRPQRSTPMTIAPVAERRPGRCRQANWHRL